MLSDEVVRWVLVLLGAGIFWALASYFLNKSKIIPEHESTEPQLPRDKTKSQLPMISQNQEKPHIASDLEWNFERHKGMYFIGMKYINDRLVITQFQAQGRNNTDNPLEHVRGHVRSEKTTKKYPTVFNIGGTMHAAELLNPIPVGAIIDTYTFFTEDRQGIPVWEFMRDFVPFTFFFEYDGQTYKRKFEISEIEPLIQSYEQFMRQKFVQPPQITVKEN